MQFNKQWKEFLTEARYPGLLLEARVKDIKAKYPALAESDLIYWAQKQITSLLGPKGVSKYLLYWARETHRSYSSYSTEDFLLEREDVLKIGEVHLDLIMHFHENQHKLEEKDIYKYNIGELQKSMDDLGVTQAALAAKEEADEEEAEENSEVVYVRHGVFAVRPLTTQAACYFGHNPRLTKWCISEKEKLNYFKQYTEEEGKAFVMVTFKGIPESHPNHLITLECDHEGDITMIWDAPNDAHNPDLLYDIALAHLEGLHAQLRQDVENAGRDAEAEVGGYDEEDAKDKAKEIVAGLKEDTKEEILDNPPLNPAQAAEKRCKEAKTIADADYEFVHVSYTVVTGPLPYTMFGPGETPAVMFSADLEVAWDIDKPEYEDEAGNVLLNKGRDFWEEFQRKFSDNLMKKGRPWSDMADQVSCYVEDDYVKLSIKFRGNDSSHPPNAAGFESFCAEDCRAIENRGEQMQELLSLMLNAEAGVSNAPREEEDYTVPPGQQNPSGIEEDIQKYFTHNHLTKDSFYDNVESTLTEEKGRSRQRGIYKFYCMLSYGLTHEKEKTRGLDDILADLRACANVTIVTVVVKNQKIADGKYIAGLSVKFIPSVPGQFRSPEDVKSRILRDIRRLTNVQNIFKVSAGLERLE
jgi:hypothetical protein